MNYFTIVWLLFWEFSEFLYFELEITIITLVKEVQRFSESKNVDDLQDKDVYN